MFSADLFIIIVGSALNTIIIVAHPTLYFLLCMRQQFCIYFMLKDEPTSNLDAFQAYNVVKTLRDIAANGRTVVCTIHQPRSDIYQLFDDVLLLSEGQTVYFGPTRNAIAYFSALNFPCPEYFNPADYFMDIIAIDRRNTEIEEECTARVRILHSAFQSGFELNRIVGEYSGIAGEIHIDSSHLSKYSANYARQYALLYYRSLHQLLRDKFFFITSFGANTFFSLLLGCIFYQVGHDQPSIQSRRGLLMFTMLFSSFTQLGAVANTFPVEKGIISRERQSHLYRVSAYFLAKVTSELPIKALLPLLFSSILYWMARLKPAADAFFLFTFIVLLISLTATSLGLAISAGAPNVHTANMLNPLFMLIFMLFAGFFANLDNIPKWLVWIQWISPLRYGFESLCINEFADQHFTCVAGKPPCQVNGTQILRDLSVQTSFGYVWRDLGIMAILWAVFNTLAYFVLRVKGSTQYLGLKKPEPEFDS